MLDNNKCILTYGISFYEREKLSTLGFKIIEVTPEMTNMTLGDIIGGLRFNIFNSNPIKTKIIVLNSFSDIEIKENIDNIRGIVNDTILALPTQKNVKWTFGDLVEHLVEDKIGI